MSELRCGAYRLSLERPLIMGIVNLTPDSFSGDGVNGDLVRAIAHARRQLEAGADLLDLGAESSRPGATPPSAEEEMARLLPVLEEVVKWGVPVSVDTYKPKVMQAALKAGAAMINDINGMTDPDALAIVAGSDCGVCVMHMQGRPGTMQAAPLYDDVVGEVSAFLEGAIKRCRAAGVAGNRLVVDPGFGFGKTLVHNLSLFRALTVPPVLQEQPVLVGVSRKSMLGEITGRAVGERMVASVTGALLAAQRGAKILRVHDVAETRDALAVWTAIEQGEKR